MKNHNFLIIFALIILNMKYMWMIIFMEVCFDRPWRMLFPAAVRFGSQEV